MSKTYPWDIFVEHEDLKADLVGGQLIGIVNGVHTVLGHVNDDELFLTDAGKAVKEAISESGEKPRRGRHRAEAHNEPQAHNVEVSDSVTTTEQLG